jgi:DNA-binding transcriptional MerR regulator
MTEPITISTAARIIGHPESTVRFWAKRGLLPSLCLPSGLRIFEKADVERFARERQQPEAATA